jgi:hypothetical protein
MNALHPFPQLWGNAVEGSRGPGRLARWGEHALDSLLSIPVLAAWWLLYRWSPDPP